MIPAPASSITNTTTTSTDLGPLSFAPEAAVCLLTRAPRERSRHSVRDIFFFCLLLYRSSSISTTSTSSIHPLFLHERVRANNTSLLSGLVYIRTTSTPPGLPPGLFYRLSFACPPLTPFDSRRPTINRPRTSQLTPLTPSLLPLSSCFLPTRFLPRPCLPRLLRLPLTPAVPPPSQPDPTR